MAKMIRHDYSAIHEALNKMIIAEMKAALELLPGKKIEADGQTPLCRVVVSPDCYYSPRDLSVRKVWVDENGLLNVYGSENRPNVDVDTEWYEHDDMLDITDFSYLIDQIAAKVPEDGKPLHLAHESDVAELSLKAAVEKLVTV